MKGLKLWEVLKALDEGKDLKYSDKRGVFFDNKTNDVSLTVTRFESGFKYYIKPKVEVKEFLGYVKKDEMFFCIGEQEPVDTHKITIEFKDDEPICSSIKMEKL